MDKPMNNRQAQNLIESVLAKKAPLTEAKMTTVEEFIKAMDAVINKHFPNAYREFNYKDNFSQFLSMKFAIPKSKQEWPNGMFEGALGCLAVNFIGVDNKTGMLADKLKTSVSRLHNGRIRIMKAPGSYNAIGHADVGLKQKTGTPEQMIKQYDGHFAKVKATLKSYVNMISQEDKDLVKSYKF